MRLTLEDGSAYALPGKVDFAEAGGRPEHRHGDPARPSPIRPASAAAGHGTSRPQRPRRPRRTRSLRAAAGASARDPRGNATAWSIGPGDRAILRPVSGRSHQVGDKWRTAGGFSWRLVITEPRQPEAQPGNHRSGSRQRKALRPAASIRFRRALRPPATAQAADRARRPKQWPLGRDTKRAMISRIFIDRPVFAFPGDRVIVIMLAGLSAIQHAAGRAVSRHRPALGVNIRATYPGRVGRGAGEQRHPNHRAAAHRHRRADLLFNSTLGLVWPSQSDGDLRQGHQSRHRPGSGAEQGAAGACPACRVEVQQQGLIVTKSNPDFLLIASIYDQTDRQSAADVSDYLVSNLQEPVGRLAGVGDVRIFGAQYAMRIWLDPYKLAAVKAVPSDVVSAIQAQNTQVAAGQIGALPLRRRPNAERHGHGALAPDQRRPVPQDHHQDPDRRLARCCWARIGPGRKRQRKLFGTLKPPQWPPGVGHRGKPRPRRADALKTAELVRAEILKPGRNPSRPGYAYAFPNTTPPPSSSCRCARWCRP